MYWFSVFFIHYSSKTSLLIWRRLITKYHFPHRVFADKYFQTTILFFMLHCGRGPSKWLYISSSSRDTWWHSSNWIFILDTFFCCFKQPVTLWPCNMHLIISIISVTYDMWHHLCDVSACPFLPQKCECVHCSSQLFHLMMKTYCATDTTQHSPTTQTQTLRLAMDLVESQNTYNKTKESRQVR